MMSAIPRAVLGALLVLSMQACGDDASDVAQDEGSERGDAGDRDNDERDSGDRDVDEVEAGEGGSGEGGAGGTDRGGHAGAGGESGTGDAGHGGAGTGAGDGIGGTSAGDGSSGTTGEPDPDPIPDAGTPDGSDPDPDPDPDPVVLNGCESFVDRTAAGATRSLTWDESIGGRAERCITIRAGQLLCWVGDFETHPLLAHGGDTPTPIDGSDCVTFEDEGDYGYVCTFHPDMLGVVRVVP